MFGWRRCDRGANSIENTVATMALVCSAPNFTTPHITVDSAWGSTYFLLNKLDHRQFTGPKFILPFLTTLYVNHPENPHYPPFCIEGLDGLLRSAPNLSTLRIDHGCSIGTLTVRLCNINVIEGDLKALVGSGARLAEVVLTSRGKREYYLPISPRRALYTLAPTRLALRRLALHTWMPEDGHIVNYHYPNPPLKPITINHNADLPT